jgi:hypothetical protein
LDTVRLSQTAKDFVAAFNASQVNRGQVQERAAPVRQAPASNAAELRAAPPASAVGISAGAAEVGPRPEAGVPAGLREVADFERERVLELSPGAVASAVRPGDAVATLWSSAGVVLTLAEPRRIGRVAFELSDAEWRARPTVEASLDGLAWETVEATASLADATLSLYRDPRHARGEIRFAPRELRVLRVDARLPARGGVLELGE